MVGASKCGKSLFARHFKDYIEYYSKIDGFLIHNFSFAIVFEFCRQLMAGAMDPTIKASRFIIVDGNIMDRKQRFELSALASMYNGITLQLYFETDMDILMLRNAERIASGDVTQEALLQAIAATAMPSSKFTWENHYQIPKNYMENITQCFMKVLEYLTVTTMFSTKLVISPEIVNFFIHVNKLCFDEHVNANGNIPVPYLGPRPDETRCKLLRCQLPIDDTLALTMRFLDFFVLKTDPPEAVAVNLSAVLQRPMEGGFMLPPLQPIAGPSGVSSTVQPPRPPNHK